MLLLVFAYGNSLGIVEQNVGGHEHGIGEQAYRHILSFGFRFVLELGHTL